MQTQFLEKKRVCMGKSVASKKKEKLKASQQLVQEQLDNGHIIPSN